MNNSDFSLATVCRPEHSALPRGVEHRLVAEEEVHVMLFEPVSTVNTGNVQDGRTVDELERI